MALRVAQELHKTLSEIGSMPVSEFQDWAAFLRIQREAATSHSSPERSKPQPWQQTYMGLQMLAARYAAQNPTKH